MSNKQMKPLLRGETLISVLATEVLPPQLALACLWKHVNCDWADSCSEQAEDNEDALSRGRGEVKSLHLAQGAVILIVTELDHGNRTTICFAREKHPFEVRSFDDWTTNPPCRTCGA